LSTPYGAPTGTSSAAGAGSRTILRHTKGCTAPAQSLSLPPSLHDRHLPAPVEPALEVDAHGGGLREHAEAVRTVGAQRSGRDQEQLRAEEDGAEPYAGARAEVQHRRATLAQLPLDALDVLARAALSAERADFMGGGLWRRLAHWGASRGPEWFVRYSPPLFGLAACALAGESRRAIGANLRRVRGSRGPARDALDVARTFATYASCLTEILGAGSPRARLPRGIVVGELHLLDALAGGRGVVVVTAHTAGWETVGPLLSRDHGLRVMIAVQAERDRRALRIQDAAREAHGLLVVHVGDSPLAALPLVRHLRCAGIVALQIDRVPAGMRTRAVSMFGRDARMPEGPLRLASLTGAPVLPVFAARVGHRSYRVEVCAPVRLSRRPTDADLDGAAQGLASCLETFVRARPTQWFHFRES
jgi:KDO2-lipid IV(A) lauroyltransferase